MRGPAPPIFGLGRPPFPSPLVFFLDGHFQPCLQKSKHDAVGNPPGQALHQGMVRDAVEIAGEVGADHLGVARVDASSFARMPSPNAPAALPSAHMLSFPGKHRPSLLRHELGVRIARFEALFSVHFR